jgi:TatD DNase family protein
MIDTHAHLDFEDFDTDREEVIQSALDSGVFTIVNIGTDLKSSIRCVELADTHDCIYAVVGFHPHDSRNFDKPGKEHIARLAQHPKVVAIGEIGLDYYRDYSPRDIQQKVFVEQIAMAREFGMPIVVHIRDAMPEALSILKTERAFEVGGVLHCFPGTPKDARRAADMNFAVSFGGALTFKKARALNTALDVPLDHIILETDCPFMTPVPYRGKRNQPSYVRYAYRQLAEAKGTSFDELEKTVDENAIRLFNLGDGKV